MGRKLKSMSLFYKVLLGIILLLLLIFVYLRFGMLRPWLTRFEAAQPKHASQEVFNDLFSPADWGKIYDLAGLDNSAYQGREDFIQSMEALTAEQTLTFVETSAGLSGDRRYIVKAGNESVAAFTLTDDGEETGETAWRLDTVEMLLGQTGTVYVRAQEGHSVTVNGTRLGEDCQVQLIEKVAHRYLPQGVQGKRTILWQARVSTIQQAKVSILDEGGAELPLTYDAEKGCFMEDTGFGEPDEEQRTQIIGAAKSYALYMVRAGSAAQLKKYFDSGSEIYKTIRSSELWIAQTSEQTFSNENISEFCSYGEDVFSARVSMHLDIKRANGTYKPYEVDSTLFFHRVDGKWLSYDMTNMDVQEEIVNTRLVFMVDQEEAGRMFVSSEDRSFTPPVVTPPEGQRFAGWATRENEGGSVAMIVRFLPGADGTVALPADYVLEPMTLYAAFEAV